MSNRSIQEIDETMAQVASDLEDLREKRAVMIFQYEQKEDVWHQRINKLDQRWIKRRSERKPHEYVDAMDKLQGKQKLIPSKVIRKQADLCKSFHMMEVLDQEVDRIKDQHGETICLLHEQIKEINDEKDKLELDYLNKLCAAEGELNEVRDQQGKFMRKHNMEWLEKEESMSAVDTLGTFDEDSGEEDSVSVSPEGTNIMRGIKTIMWGSFHRIGSHATTTQTSAPTGLANTPEKRRRATSKLFTPPPPRKNSREIKACDRQHMVDWLMAS
mmetsp:Transcript_18927/g.31331  ORF Transcript_18927/g.31331 Transcript_18927/m.31331 type:complete len:272 (-) Transcript_18927:186-1001(-)